MRLPTMSLDATPLLHLLWLASPALPVGGFSYSEGLEAAVDAGLVHDEISAGDWLLNQLELVQARAELPVALGVGDIHLVTLLPSCASLVFPSKLYGAAAIGRPILYLGPKDAEPARVIRAAGCGLTMAPDDPDAIAAELRQLASDPAWRNELGAAARRLAEAGGAERAVAAWHNQLARLASG